MNEVSLLIVDDNKSNLKLLSYLLGKRGYFVKSASSALDAMEVLKSFEPRVILMDLQMPGIDGLELTRRLKADPATRGIVIVAVTAYAMQGDENLARDAGCDGYVTKPIDTRTLCATLTEILSQKSSGTDA